MFDFKEEYHDFFFKNRAKYKNRIDTRNAFLHTLPKGREFTEKELDSICKRKNLVVPVSWLIERGKACNWNTAQGHSFHSAEVFATAYNGVYLQEMRKKARKEEHKLSKQNEKRKINPEYGREILVFDEPIPLG